MKLAKVFFIGRLLVIAGIVSASLAMAVSDAKYQAINERLQPVGKVCIEGDSCASEVASAATTSAEPRTGQQIYDAHCTMCHAQGVAGAPKLGDTAAWADRIAKGFDTLYTNALNGIGAMPAKGLCMDCSDDEIKNAVKYITEGK